MKGKLDEDVIEQEVFLRKRIDKMSKVEVSVCILRIYLIERIRGDKREM